MNEIKQSLIEEINRRVQDKILEPSNASLLIKLIQNAESKDEAINIAALGTTYKRTGLHFDKRLEKMSDSIRYFRKNEKLSFYTDGTKPVNKLIIGDNYEALQNLLIQYRGAIDVIYIDPPYGKDSMGEFARTNYENAITRDNLLSMLYPRLILAKQLLSDEGVIFCSIDDKNQAYVKCLFDEVFGEENFVCSAPRKTGAGAAAVNADYELRKPYDYVLCYLKNKFSFKFQKEVVGEKEYNYSDEKGRYMIGSLQATGSDATRKARPKLYYPIYLLNDETLSIKESSNVKKVFLPNKVNGEDGRWMWSKEKFEISNKDLFVKNDKIHRKIYFDESKDQTIYKVHKAYFDETKYQNSVGTKLLKEIFPEKVPFANPKPVDLVSHLIQISSKSSSTILDFFAGSGTTGHAVLDLNRQDGGNRTFILCQLNEKTDINPNGIAYDVTAKRLKRIMTGECYDGTKDFPWIKDNKPYGGNLDVYEIGSVANFETAEGKSAFDVIDETLYGKQKFTTVKEKIDWVCQNFEKTQKKVEE